MPVWKFQVGRGWRDGKVPADVQKTLTIHPDGQGKLSVLSINAYSDVGEGGGGSDIPIFEGAPADAIRTTGTIFRLLATLLGHLSAGEYDVVSLIFVNFKPKTFSLTPRPDPFMRNALSLEDGLSQFSQDVTASLEGSESMWSTCEWAMLSAHQASD